MIIEVEQNVMSIRIKAMVVPDDWRSEVVFVHKRWEWYRENGPLFADFSIEPAMVSTDGGGQGGQNPVARILKMNVYNAVGTHLAYQLDQMFKTREDFKRKVVVTEYGPLFLVRWTEEATNDN